NYLSIWKKNSPEGDITLYAEPTSFSKMQHYLEDNGFEVKSAEFSRIPNDEKALDDEQRAAIDKLVDRLEDDDDVQNVYTNMAPLAEE
ncbi:MAG TPA: YebC/PmpR family DNA-binding transcriptional regulator, partial [Bacteroidaceae bacterium]|nr:YebC/PmpR family DNA-binding transcriptional regulator [Bacteroidaceae bacterium]